MVDPYVHGYHPKESTRLQDQAATLVDLLHSDTSYPPGSLVLEAGCGVGAQTVPLAKNSPGAKIKLRAARTRWRSPWPSSLTENDPGKDDGWNSS